VSDCAIAYRPLADGLVSYGLDLSQVVPSGDPIANLTLAARPSGAGELTVTALSVAGTLATFTARPGVPGRSYLLEALATGVSGLVYPARFQSWVDRAFAVYPPAAPQSDGPGLVAAWPSYYTGLILNGNALTVVDPTNWPTDNAGLPPGAVWLNGSLVNAVPSAAAVGQALFATLTRATDLLAAGAAFLPVTDPGVLNQLWVNGAVVMASTGNLTGLAAVGTAVTPTDETPWPTAPDGLPPGAIWLNGSFLNAVPGYAAAPTAPVFLGFLTGAELLAYGAVILPLADPGVAGQLWFNGVMVCVSTGS
jgi:hypothetical protein